MESYQSKPQGKFRHRKVFSIGIIVTSKTIEWTDKWFKFVEIEEEKCLERYKHFDDGWTYTFYWSKWKPVWEFRKLI